MALSARLALVVVLGLGAAGCVDAALDAPGVPCPCVTGYVCCVTAGWCVPEDETSCPDVLAVREVRPGTGPVAGGFEIEVRGDGFRPGDRVRVGGLPCPATSTITSVSITCRAPPGRGMERRQP